MNSILKTVLGSSPKTTIIGWCEAVLIAVYPIFIDPNFTWQKDGIILLVAAIRAVFARISKDSNGITAEQSKQIHEDVKELIDPVSH